MSEVTTMKQNVQSTSTVKKITATAVMAALATLMTAYIFHIPVGVNGGYVHLGDTMAIRVYLDDVLRARGMTAKELCAKVGITEANLSILRSGKARGVRFGTLNRICYYLECDAGDILKFDGQLEEENDA